MRFQFNGLVVSEEKMFENVDTDAEVTGILLAHP